ncbi:hypothetical protein [Schlesneria sp. DSM 10557]|uniref:hypothetical protein n=1 Tax=Schlesneria sp. DSM 10557 TaxID=3044399 RepID=UPI0035C7D645
MAGPFGSFLDPPGDFHSNVKRQRQVFDGFATVALDHRCLQTLCGHRFHELLMIKFDPSSLRGIADAGRTIF